MKTMSDKMTWQKILILCALFVAPLLLARCGPSGSEHVPSSHVGPAGPTSPSNYYFELTIAPHTLHVGGWVLVVVRVWDQYGNATPSVRVNLTVTGFNKTKITLWDYTDTNGLMQGHVEAEADSNYIGYITVEVEGTFLTLPITVLVGGS
jgi:hypothetical protein